jgi:hypothetical protein
MIGASRDLIAHGGIGSPGADAPRFDAAMSNQAPRSLFHRCAHRSPIIDRQIIDA